MIYPVTMYSGKCDNCGTEIKLGGGEYMAYGEKWQVEEDMKNTDWLIQDGKHYCDDCWSYDDEDNIVLKPVNK